MILEGTDCGDDDHSVGLQACHTALDVQEFLCAQVGSEAGFRDAVVAKLKGHAGGCDGVAAVGDVGEGAAVHEGRGMLQGLDQVGLDGIL